MNNSWTFEDQVIVDECRQSIYSKEIQRARQVDGCTCNGMDWSTNSKL